MSGDDYLWDGSGDQDPEVMHLEALLRPLRSGRPAPEFVGVADDEEALHGAGAPTRWFRAPAWSGLAAAAVLVVAAAATWNLAHTQRQGWTLQRLEGASWDRTRVVRQAQLAAGQTLDTKAGRVRLAVGEIGEVQLEPGTRVRLLDAGGMVHRLALDHGTMHALIWAPPGQFVVDTPAATAIDLGCSYTLQVDEDGSGVLRVEAGWVGFVHEGVRSLVPADAEAAVRPGHGPGTPYFSDGSPAFVAALRTLDFGASDLAREEALETVLAAARPRDALSLWHLLARTSGSSRSRVYERLASLVPPPEGVTREGVLRGDRAMSDAWWDVLGLGSAEGWGEWTAPYHEPSR